MLPSLERLRSVLLFACVALAFGASSARAQTSADQRARDLYVQGDRAYNEGRYEEAVQAFAESYRLSGRPLLLFNLANAYERLGRYQDALTTLRQYAPSAAVQEQAQIRARIAALEQRAASSPSGTSSASSSDDGLLITGIVVGSVGLVLGVGGAVMGALALDARGEAQAGCVTGPDGATLCDASVRDAIGRDTTFALLADIGIGVGAAALAAGVVLAILGATSGGSEASASVVPYVAPRAQGGELGVVVTY